MDPLCQEQVKYRGRLCKSFHRKKKAAIDDEWEKTFYGVDRETGACVLSQRRSY